MADGGIDILANFQPNSNNSKMLRDSFSRFATGVTIVTCGSADGHIGITANSFSSISLDPALIMWALAKKSSRFKYFDVAKYFAIHVLDIKQHQICNDFSKRNNAFENLNYSISENGVPLIENCLARFSCIKDISHNAGDHQIVIGKVLNAQMRDGDPLTFYAGQFGKIQARY
ncbi:MAG: flavin reductase family protein [Amylibacter sp.]